MKKHVRRRFLEPYHYAWAILSALWYRLPARHFTVIGITGTKGKSSVAEMLHAILTHAGHTTALAGTVRFSIGTESRPNRFKMTLPGRGFIQKFLAEARRKGATHAVVEITSEAALQYRHRCLALDGLIFTNLHREHIESHGSLEKYFRAKLNIGTALVRSPKRPRIIVANDDEYGASFLALPVEKRIPFSQKDVRDAQVSEDGVSFIYNGVHVSLSLPGTFNLMNALASIKMAEALGIPPVTSARALAALAGIPGRGERIEAGQDFIVVVDYAHTPDSLQALYGAFSARRKICVLGNTGGGRDTWKRPLMGRIADDACDTVIFTNEDPYDEDPRSIIDAMAAGTKREPILIMDRREAIQRAIREARPGDAVLITGKGTDPFIMGPHGRKEPWSDSLVVREELEHLFRKA